MILRWLLPIGLLGLLGLVVLIIIYIIKPRHKQKIVSSTFVWKRALQYKKKKVPINIFNNLIIILLQALVLTCAALILAQPHLFSEDILLLDSEYIIIIDASANMRAKEAGVSSSTTRFDKAVAEVETQINEVFNTVENASISVILANEATDYLFNGAKKEDYQEVHDALSKIQCSYVEGDVEEALLIAQQRLYSNPAAQIYLYTGTEYGEMGTALTVVNFADKQNEWNIAVLGCEVGYQDNEYVFNITVGAYGDVVLQRTMYVTFKDAVNEFTGETRNYTLQVPVTFQSNADGSGQAAIQTIAVRASNTEFGGNEDWFFESYDEVLIEFRGLNDSIPDDDTYKVYGGYKDRIYVQYWSQAPNVFWQLGFTALKENMRKTRDIEITMSFEGQKAENSGYDIYIFEHSIPEEILTTGLPKDGIIIFADPDNTLAFYPELGLHLGEAVNFPRLANFSAPNSHPLLRYFNPEDLGVTQYTKMVYDESSFNPVLYCGDDPVMLVQKTATSQIIVLPFSINMSNFYGTELQMFLYNMLDYFMPYTITDYDYTVYESATVNCKGASLTVQSEVGESEALTRIPAEYQFTELGTYTFTTRFGLEKSREVRKVYVHRPSSESSLFKISDFRIALDNEEITGEVGTDIFLYFAIAIFALLLVEWCLQFKDIV